MLWQKQKKNFFFAYFLVNRDLFNFGFLQSSNIIIIFIE